MHFRIDIISVFAERFQFSWNTDFFYSAECPAFRKKNPEILAKILKTVLNRNPEP